MSTRPSSAAATTQRAWQRLRALSWRARLAAVAMLLLAATLFNPSWPLQRSAYDFVVAFDVTQSMNVADHRIEGKPASRLEYAKRVVRESLGELPCGSRVGWAIFTEYRILLLTAPVEVCDNYHDLAAVLDRIDGRMAWTNASEVAKGLFWGLRTAKELGGGHGIVLITDGHESPPISPRHRPVYDGKPGEVRGLIVGAGGDALEPIPKTDPAGVPLGFWQADEVMQTDVFSAGRTGSSAGERMVDETGQADEAMPPTMIEHLSSLREPYLQRLASETAIGYHRLADAPAMLRALREADMTRPAPYRADLRVPLASLALLLLAAIHLPRPPPGGGWRRWLRRPKSLSRRT